MPPTEPSLSWMAEAFHATPFRLSLPHLRSIGGKYTGLASMNRAFSMAFFLTHWPLKHRVGGKMFVAVALFGIATIVFGLSTWFPLSLLALFVLGASDMVSVYIRHMLVQLETPDGIRGRVSAVNAVFIGASNELGEFESGVTAAWWGLKPAVVVGGIASVAIAGLWMRGFPALRRIDEFPEPATKHS